MWLHKHTIIIGGLIAVGVDSSSRYLLAISHNGRGLFDLESGERVARDHEDWAGSSWYSHDQNTCVGIGICASEIFHISGIHGVGICDSTPDKSILCRIEQDDFSWKSYVTVNGFEESISADEEELKTYGLSQDGTYFFTGVSFEIDVFKRLV